MQLTKTLAILLACAVAPVAALADIVKVKASGDVAATADALQAAVEGAGATLFARVDHAGGAEKVGMPIAPAQLLIFGNPKLGTPAMRDDMLAGLYLPLKVLVYEDGDGQTWLAYDDPAALLSALDGVSGDAEYLGKMAGALGNLTGAAAGN